MRTFGLWVAGWLVGAAVLVLLDLPALRRTALPAQTAPDGSPAASGIRPAAYRPAPGTVLLPVLGVLPRDLRDTYEQARGGGVRTHHALYFLAPRGTPVLAAVDGTIRKLFISNGGGITIYQFDVPETHVYYYAHLERYAPSLAEGQFVRQGTVIGYVGTTGNAPPGTPHLHFAIDVLPATKEWWKGQPVNPYPILTAGAPVIHPESRPSP
jgi:murein DD-endopeptidase MepM/ murein hydrolase activator NlpD